MTATKPLSSDQEESNFGIEAPFALGVEEELLLVGSDGQLVDQLVDQGSAVVDEAEPDRGDVVGELFKAMVESNSDVSTNAGEAIDALRAIREELIASGSRLMGAGVHPDARSGEAGVDDAPRFQAIKGDLQGLLRTPLCGQHVHVGMPDAESAVRSYNGIRTHVPLLNALAANSPFWFGRDSGLASARTVVFRSYPRAAMAPEFADIDHFWRVIHEVCAAGGLDDYTHIWWDARIHPALGTIEVRAADAQFDLDRASGLAALVHCLTRLEAERDQSGIPSREALAESSFQATRHGLEADLLNRRAEPVPARRLAEEAMEEAAPYAAELGCTEALSHIETILDQGNGADVQRRVFAEKGMDGLLAFLAEATVELA